MQLEPTTYLTGKMRVSYCALFPCLMDHIKHERASLEVRK